MKELNLDFNHLFILECFENQEDQELLKMYTIPSLKDFVMSTAYQSLVKNEYLVEDPEDTSKIILSVKAKNTLLKLRIEHIGKTVDGMTPSVVLMDFSKSPEECFEEWWKTYPTSTKWKTDDEVVFMGSRTLKNITKAKAKKEYLALLNKGLKHEDLLGSLLFEIKLKKLDSIKKNENQMDFFKGMESYLKQARYMLYIDHFKENPEFVKDEKLKKKKQNVTDI